MKLQDIQKMLSERKLTKAESKKKEEIAQAMEKEHPGMGSTPEGMSKKMAIATAQAKKCCEEIEGELETEETLDEVSNYDLVVNYYRHLGLDPYKLRGTVGKQLRTKIKASPAFQAWARINSSFEYEKKYTQIIEKIKEAKKEAKGKVQIDFFGYPESTANTSNSDKDIAQTDDNFITPN